jgi:hypothetical protein
VFVSNVLSHGFPHCRHPKSASRNRKVRLLSDCSGRGLFVLRCHSPRSLTGSRGPDCCHPTSMLSQCGVPIDRPHGVPSRLLVSLGC